MKFEELKLGSDVLTAIKRMGFEEPTEIQTGSIPAILEGKDVAGESATGSGKTLAFGVGIIEGVQPGQGLQAIVLTPTRELAEQVKEAIKKLTTKLKFCAVYGGVSINPQIDDLQRCEVVVATPGRCLDHLERGTMNTSKIKVLVLDEADRMVDMGFIDDVRRIIQAVPEDRQTLFFSATLGGRVSTLAREFLRDPVFVNATKMVDPTKLKQIYVQIQKNLKFALLAHYLKKEPSLAMVFCNTRHNVDFVVKNLKANGVNAMAIHGGMTQNKRTMTIEHFNKASACALVCTDVAARGLHIDDVSYVYNYDIPKDATDYVHRIGRTARAGSEGKVINILCDMDHDNFARVLDTHRDFKVEKQDPPQVKSVKLIIEQRGRTGGRSNFRRPFNRSGGGGHGHRRRHSHAAASQNR